jgi:Flp pilus assembly pilin Flp
MVEYSLIFLLVALVAMASLRGLGANSNKQLQSVNTNME